MFQSTHPHGVRQPWGTATMPFYMFQSTHPHGVRLVQIHSSQLLLFVSIHAPARGATRIRNEFGEKIDVSIHAPARGATWSVDVPDVLSQVSIHAPARGATEKIGCADYDYKFQSTHPHGVRPNTSTMIKINDSFNPRTRTGCDMPRNKRKSR